MLGLGRSFLGAAAAGALATRRCARNRQRYRGQTLARHARHQQRVKEDSARVVSEEFPRVAVITGGTSRFGGEIARGLSRSGEYDKIIVIGRNCDRGNMLVSDLNSSELQAEFLEADLANLDEVKLVCAALRGINLKCLICAAGVTALGTRRQTPDGNEYHLGLNFLSRFLMVNTLVDDMAQAGTEANPARVILVGSDRHWGPPFLGFSGLGGSVPLAHGHLEDLQLDRPGAYDPWVAFGQAALCNVMFSYELQRRLRRCGIRSVAVSCVNPGPMATAWDLYKNEENRMRASEIPEWMREAMRYFTRVVESPEAAATAPVFLATTAAGSLPAKYEIGTSGGYWERCEPAPSKYPLPWSWGTSYDEETWSQLWEHSQALIESGAPSSAVAETSSLAEPATAAVRIGVPVLA